MLTPEPIRLPRMRPTLIQRVVAGLISVTLLSTGSCSTIEHVSLRGGHDTLSYSALNRKLAREKANILTKEGNLWKAGSVRVLPDSCVWMDLRTGRERSALLSDIQLIELTSSWGGIWRGYIIGVLGGGILFYAITLAEDQEGDKKLDALGRALLPFVGAAIGGLVGAVIGGLRGYDVSYRVDGSILGMDVIHLRNGSRMIGRIVELVPGKEIVFRTWDGDRCVLDAALVERIASW